MLNIPPKAFTRPTKLGSIAFLWKLVLRSKLGSIAFLWKFVLRSKLGSIAFLWKLVLRSKLGSIAFLWKLVLRSSSLAPLDNRRCQRPRAFIYPIQSSRSFLFFYLACVWRGFVLGLCLFPFPGCRSVQSVPFPLPWMSFRAVCVFSPSLDVVPCSLCLFPFPGCRSVQFVPFPLPWMSFRAVCACVTFGCKLSYITFPAGSGKFTTEQKWL